MNIGMKILTELTWYLSGSFPSIIFSYRSILILILKTGKISYMQNILAPGFKVLRHAFSQMVAKN